MELKKNPKADLARKTSLFFSIGLVVTMSLVISAFEWKYYEPRIADLVQRYQDPFEELINIPPTEILPLTPPVPAPLIEEVSDDEVVKEINAPVDIETIANMPIFIAAIEVEVEPTDVPFISPESPATFNGGISTFYKHISDNVHYPAQARHNETQGKVYVEFVINRDGSVTDVKVVKGIGAGCDEEAIRVIRNSPPWNPAKQRGVPVRQRMVLPIIFRLGQS